jgi:hypothetical protein
MLAFDFITTLTTLAAITNDFISVHLASFLVGGLGKSRAYDAQWTLDLQSNLALYEYTNP